MKQWIWNKFKTSSELLPYISPESKKYANETFEEHIEYALCLFISMDRHMLY